MILKLNYLGKIYKIVMIAENMYEIFKINSKYRWELRCTLTAKTPRKAFYEYINQ